MIMVQAVTYSDVIILNYLKSKAPHGSEFPLRNADIITQTGIPECTVRRALSRLHRAGLITRKPIGKIYLYKVTHHDSSASTR